MPVTDFQPQLDQQALVGACAGATIFAIGVGIELEMRYKRWRLVKCLHSCIMTLHAGIVHGAPTPSMALPRHAMVVQCSMQTQCKHLFTMVLFVYLNDSDAAVTRDAVGPLILSNKAPSVHLCCLLLHGGIATLMILHKRHCIVDLCLLQVMWQLINILD